MAAGFVTNNTIQLVKGFEGCKLNAYLLENVVHIGYGFTYYKSGYLRNKFGRSTVRLGDKITQAEADAELEIFLANIGEFINTIVKVDLTQGQFDALVSLCYNIGESALSGSTLIQLLNQGDYAGASAEFGRWVYSAGVVNPVLVERRKIESQSFGYDSVLAGSNILIWVVLGFVLVKIFKKQSK